VSTLAKTSETGSINKRKNSFDEDFTVQSGTLA
jgi:hypothetical protein